MTATLSTHVLDTERGRPAAGVLVELFRADELVGAAETDADGRIGALAEVETGAYLLPRLVGLPRAKAMLLLGEGCTGAEAVDLGLAYRCVGADELDGVATALAQRLAAGPTRSLGLSKRLLNASFETDLVHSLDLEGAYQALATTSGDLVEGMKAFRERRDPGFTGH